MICCLRLNCDGKIVQQVASHKLERNVTSSISNSSVNEYCSNADPAFDQGSNECTGADATDREGCRSAGATDRKGCRSAGATDREGCRSADESDREGSGSAGESDSEGCGSAGESDRVGCGSAGESDRVGCGLAGEPDREGCGSADESDREGCGSAETADQDFLRFSKVKIVLLSPDRLKSPECIHEVCPGDGRWHGSLAALNYVIKDL